MSDEKIEKRGIEDMRKRKSIFFITLLSMVIIAVSPVYSQNSISISSTSTLSPSSSMSYGPENLIDNSWRSWSEGESDDGEGVAIIINFHHKRIIDHIYIKNGFGDLKYFYENNRVKLLEVDTDGGSFVLKLEDTHAFKRYDFMDRVKTKTMVLRITDTYPGEKWNDTCMSEISFDAIPYSFEHDAITEQAFQELLGTKDPHLYNYFAEIQKRGPRGYPAVHRIRVFPKKSGPTLAFIETRTWKEDGRYRNELVHGLDFFPDKRSNTEGGVANAGTYIIDDPPIEWGRLRYEMEMLGKQENNMVVDYSDLPYGVFYEIYPHTDEIRTYFGSQNPDDFEIPEMISNNIHSLRWRWNGEGFERFILGGYFESLSQ